MAEDGKRGEGVTIVGGRPMHRAVAAEDLPQGVEQVLTIAALDHEFRASVGRDPVAAAATKGIALDAVEAGLLRSTPPAQLAAMARRLVIPHDIGRRQFVKAVSASVVALVTGKAMLLCSGCTGADTWIADASTSEQKWISLAGRTCYVYVPAEIAASATAAPVLVALHGDGETCLSSVQRWHTAADRFGFNLLAVNWTEEAATPESWDALVADLPAIITDFATYYPVTAGSTYLSSRGASTALAWRAAYLADGGFRATVLLGGVPEGDWVADGATLAQAMVANPALYYVLGKLDSDHAAGWSFYTRVAAAGDTTTKLHELEGSSSDAVLDFSTIWYWVAAQ